VQSECHLSAPQAAKASGLAASTKYAWELHAAGLAGTEPRPRERAAQRAGEATQLGIGLSVARFVLSITRLGN